MSDWAGALERLAEQAGVPGAVLGIWRDGVEEVVPYGVLNRATGVEVTADSLFQTGSVGKTWTGSMVVQLVGEGRLGLDDPVREVLPGVAIPAEVTVRQLLSHTSGIDGDVFTDTGRGDDCLERYVAGLDAEQLFEPGTAYSYCNAGFVLLGRIIEVLDGRTWDESLKARLVEPLGLRHTVTLPEQALLYRAAVGHIASGDPVKTWQLPRSLGPAGLITQSASDLLRFARLHLEDDSYAGMREPVVEYPGWDGGLTHIGLSWRLHDWSGRRVFGHDGLTMAQKAFLRVDPEARLAVCLLTNSNNANGLFEPLVSEVFEHFVGVTPPPAPEPIDLAVDDRHVGRYERAGVRMDVERGEHGLRLVYQATGDRLAFAEEPVEMFTLDPTSPPDGNHFLTRSTPAMPRTPVTFTATSMFSGGRITPKVSLPTTETSPPRKVAP